VRLIVGKGRPNRALGAPRRCVLHTSGYLGFQVIHVLNPTPTMQEAFMKAVAGASRSSIMPTRAHRQG